MKLAIVTNILPPYRVPLFNYLAQQPGIDLRVFLCAATEPNRHWEWPDDIHFAYEVGNPPIWSSTPAKTFYFPLGLVRSLSRFRPDAVIAGGTSLISLFAWLGARMVGAVFLLWSEATAVSDHPHRWLLPLRKFLVRQAQAYVGVSTLAAEYFISLGARSERVRVSLQTLDVAVFGQAVQKCRQQRDAMKRELGMRGSVVAYIGNLELYKGPDLLIRTYLRALPSCPEAELLIVGSGTMAGALENMVRAGSNTRVHFVGFKQHRDLPAYYALADLFCLFSRNEPFGIVVTEAIAAGLPVMCSKFAGAAYDLVEHGQNGYVIDPGDVEANVRLMTQILTYNSLRERMGRRSLEIARKCTVEEAGAAMLAAVASALGQC